MNPHAKAQLRRTEGAAAARGGAASGAGGSARSSRAAREEPVHVAGIAVSNASRAIPNEEGLTKLDVVRYNEAVSDWLLHEIAQRPLSLIRCPGGDFSSCHFRRHPEHERNASTGIPFVRVESLADLIASVQGGTFEFHGWGASFPRIDRPDRVTFDLDPDPDLPWRTFREAVELTRALLDSLELRWFVKTTGGKGLHFVLPIVPNDGWDEVKDFARRFAEHLANTIPTLFTANMSKAKRVGRVYVDYLRNGEGATAIAAYSLRARPGLPVAMPIAWSALDDDVRGDRFNIGNVPQILAGRRVDPWADYDDVRQSLARARRMLK